MPRDKNKISRTLDIEKTLRHKGDSKKILSRYQEISGKYQADTKDTSSDIHMI